MIQRMLILLFFMFFSLSLCGSDSIGTVTELKGIAFVTEIKTKEKYAVKKGMPLFPGNIIRTEKNSRVVIEFNGGIKRMVPESSELALLSKKDFEIYQKTDPLIQKVFILSGKKASKEEKSVIWEEKTLNELTGLFENGDYLEIHEWAQKSKRIPENPQSLYLLASACLKIGADEKSQFFFRKLVDSGSYEHRKIADLGLFLIALRAGDIKTAGELFQFYRQDMEMQSKMRSVLGRDEF